ncbi:MAG: HU family DNA-binding protein [Thermaerobacter sp.]|nr:integration host factor subunit alpha [Bacillota bacterium]REJ36711.1 MAG: integration host factor subunit alpha [Bacillota bacterium]
MNKAELINRVAEKTGLTKKDTEKAVNAVVETIEQALANGEKVSLVGFGTFEVRSRKARTGRNPQTGATIEIPASRVPAFRPGKALKERV